MGERGIGEEGRGGEDKDVQYDMIRYTEVRI